MKKNEGIRSNDGRIFPILSNLVRTGTAIITIDVNPGTVIDSKTQRLRASGFGGMEFLSTFFRRLLVKYSRHGRARERRAHGPKELVLLRRVVKLDAMRAFSETSLWNANT